MHSSSISLKDNDIDAPYRRYRILRENSPVLRIASKRDRDTYLITRHEDVAHALRDPRLSKVDATDDLLQDASSSAKDLANIIRGRKTMFRTDPPDHTRLRRTVGQSLIRREVLNLEPLIREKTRTLLSEIDISQPFDAVAKLTHPLPIFVTGKLLGIPDEDHSQLSRWAKNLVPFFEGLEFINDPQSVLETVIELDDYLECLINTYRKRPDNGLISRLVNAKEDKAKLTNAEIKATVQLLILAGNVTTSDFISNGLYRFSTNSSLIDEIRARPDLLPNMLEEILRFDPPIQLTGYISKEPIKIRQTTIPANAYLALSIGSANRDPRIFENPDQFNIHRKIGKNLCFGGGIHMCVGAGLARLIGRVFFEEFFTKVKDIQLATPPKLRESFTLRGFNRLEIALPCQELSGPVQAKTS